MTPSHLNRLLAGTALSLALGAPAALAQSAVTLDQISVTSPTPVQPARTAAPLSLPTGVLPVAIDTFSP